MQFPLPLRSPQARHLRDTLPGEPGLPLVGHTPQFLYSPLETGVRFYRKHGPIFWLSALGLTAVVMIGPDANRLVLRNKDDVFSSNQGWDFFIGRFFRRGIMLLDFDEHRHHRGIMQAAFKKPVLVRYLERMNPAIEQGIRHWRPGPRFEVLPHVKQLTLDIATDVFMGEELGPEADRINRAFIDCVRAGTAVIRYPVPGGRWKRGLRGRRILEDFFRSRIAQKRARPGEDLFSHLCLAEDENGQRFSDDDVINHMIFLMMAAHDTSTITLSTIFYELARRPEWQQRLRNEALALDTDQPSHDDLTGMKLAGQVMRESLRMIAPVHGLPRKTVRDVEFHGYHIPAGTFVMISPQVTHHLPDYWDRPEHFDPERFSEERAEHKQDPYQFIPFGGGAHMCIGLHFAEMQIKAILNQVLKRYQWSVRPGYVMPVDFTSLPTPKDRLPVRLERIEPGRDDTNPAETSARSWQEASGRR